MPVKFDLGDYFNDVFVETGIGDGGNIVKAMRAGFADIHGIEAAPGRYATAQERIGAEMARAAWRSNIMLYCGDPVAGLHQVCEKLQHKRATLLLDSRDGEDGSARRWLEEIQVVRHWFQDSLILPIIMVGGIKDGPPLGGVIDALLDMCDTYQFRILGDGTPRNILVALPPTWTQAR